MMGTVTHGEVLVVGKRGAAWTWSILSVTIHCMRHKRQGPKSTRAGCLLCKPHKRQGNRSLVKLKGIPVRRHLRGTNCREEFPA